jgi:Fe-S-cluster-containing dehydrogenase component
MPEKIQIKVQPAVCSGCLSCMTVCSMYNESYASLTGSRVQVALHPFGGVHEIAICRQCKNAACVEACSEAAITLHPEGHLVIDYGRCNACQACIEACPFDAMFWNPISDKVIKCEHCGGHPQCVEVCATGALTLRILPRGRGKKKS